jgi:TatD DNase family protein
MTAGPRPIAAVDSHCHLDDPAFDADRKAVLAAAAEAGVRQIVNVGFNPDRWQTTLALTRRHPNVFAMYGLHPHDATLWSPAIESALDELLAAVQAVAVGEIGLDYFRNRASPESQRAAFAAQIDIARRRGMPIVIHQRAAEDDLMEVLRSRTDLPPVVLHSFDGSPRLAAFARERGYFAGVGGLATRPANGSLRDTLATLPLSSILLETDAPYLVPAGGRALRNEPAWLTATANRVAALWGLEPDALLAAAGDTARRVFRLPEPETPAGGRG